MSNTTPDADFASLLQQGFESLRQGDCALAERRAIAAAERAPDHPMVLNLFALSLHGQGRNAEAIGYIERLQRLEPGERGHWMNAGTILRELKRIPEALDAYKRAQQLGENSPDFYYNVGLLHLEQGNPAAARVALGTAHAASPNDAEISFQYAVACLETDEAIAGLAALRNWSRFDRLSLELIGKIANVLLSLGDAQAAGFAIEHVLSRPQVDPPALLQSVLALERMNRVERAKVVMARLDRVDASSLGSDVVLARARLAQRDGRHDEAVACYRRLEAESTEPDHGYVHQFPLAKSLDALGRYDEAFAKLLDAHAAQTRWTERVMPEVPELKSDTLRITRFGCDPVDVSRWDHAGAPDYLGSPIFIVAFPRSGTTLLEQALDAHPRLKSMDEQPYLQNTIERLRGKNAEYPGRMADLTRAELDDARAYYWSLVRARVELRPGEQLIDKNPLNILRVPVIARLFPHARIVLAIRHPLDVLLSSFMQLFRAEFAWHCRDLSTLSLAMRRAFDYWYQQSAILQPAAIEMRYESFVGDFGTGLRELASFLDLPWTDAMLAPMEHAQRKGYISTPSYAQVVEPVHARSVERWRNYARHLTPALDQLQPYLDRWGYKGVVVVDGWNSK